MLITELGIVTADSISQYMKVLYSICVMPLPKIAEVRLLQPKNAEDPKLVTELGIVMVSKLSQPQKALYPMVFTEFEISTELRLLQY